MGNEIKMSLYERLVVVAVLHAALLLLFFLLEGFFQITGLGIYWWDSWVLRGFTFFLFWLISPWVYSRFDGRKSGR